MYSDSDEEVQFVSSSKAPPPKAGPSRAGMALLGGNATASGSGSNPRRTINTKPTLSHKSKPRSLSPDKPPKTALNAINSRSSKILYGESIDTSRAAQRSGMNYERSAPFSSPDDEDEDEEMEMVATGPSRRQLALEAAARREQKGVKAVVAGLKNKRELDEEDYDMEEVERDGPPQMGFQKQQALRSQLSALESEIKSVLSQIEPLQVLHRSLLSERSSLQTQLSALSAPSSLFTHDSGASGMARAGLVPMNGIGKGKAGRTDYMKDTGGFEWSVMMRRRMRDIWGIEEFRLCQEGVCNANMENRDILCVMPTGGGKSLTYQLPALLSLGTTIVISPLLSLISDQCISLREKGVECVMLTGATSKAEQNDAFRRMSDGPKKGEREIKLCYVTPEKIAKSKRFMSVLEHLNSAGRLARIVIDEAHCCSQMGHDFRPDYKKLSVLKTYFPKVPILAVTATLSRKVLPDLLKILKLPALTDGRSADQKGTVYFTAPLYRKNLHYKVVPKPSNAKAAIETMADYIKKNHLGKCGIIYCLSKKDSEVVAEGIRAASNGAIKTGVYHADVGDAAKERIHMDWREGRIHCVCATIAFGLGIDCPMTQYVLHHSLSKSMDGYYQETGRAGRDGRDADCVLFYRGQDATRLSGLTIGDATGQEKIYEMLRYAQDLKSCRKVMFAQYFSTNAGTSTSAWDDADTVDGVSSSNGITVCGHCDNCIRPPDSIEEVDVTVDVWRILRVMNEVSQQSGRVTVSGLADLARGLGGGNFTTIEQAGKKRGKVSQEKGAVDVQAINGGKVTLSKDLTEMLLIQLILDDYLKEDFHATAYNTNVYMQPGTKAFRLSRLSREEVDAGLLPVSIKYIFPKSAKKAASTAGKGVKRKRASAKKESGIDGEDGISDSVSSDELVVPPKRSKAKAKAPAKFPRLASSDLDDDDGFPGGEDFEAEMMGIEDDEDDDIEYDDF